MNNQQSLLPDRHYTLHVHDGEGTELLFVKVGMAGHRIASISDSRDVLNQLSDLQLAHFLSLALGHITQRILEESGERLIRASMLASRDRRE